MSIGWWDILKSDIRNEAQYNAASLDERRRWHIRQARAYRKRLSVLRTQHTVDLTDTENPIYQEMEEYQRLRNFPVGVVLGFCFILLSPSDSAE